MEVSVDRRSRNEQVGTRLRALRETAGKSLDEVAGYLNCPTARINRIEMGQISASIFDMHSMLKLYCVVGPRRDELLDLITQSRKPSWWSEFRDVIPDEYDIFLDLLDVAVSLENYESYILPGLLQTREYAHAILAPHLDLPDAHVDRIVELRMLSQEAVLDRLNPPQTHFYIDEIILRRPIGDFTAMRGQLEHLAQLSTKPNVTLQVVPIAAGLISAAGFPFVFFGFADDIPTVYVEQLRSSRYVNRPDKVTPYTLILQELRAVALSPDDSVALFTDLARDLE